MIRSWNKVMDTFPRLSQNFLQMRTSSFLTTLFKDQRLRRLLTGSAAVLGAALLVPACSNAPKVPAPLESVAHYSENLYDAARASDWPAAAAQLDTLKRGVTDLSAMAAGSAELESQVATVGTSVSNHDRAATMRSANEVTRLAADLTRPYEPLVPVEITLLDYSGRELELWAEAGDLAKLHDATATMRQTWDAVRRTVEKQRGGAAAAASFDALVTRAESAAASSDYAAVATPILDEVDKLERLFP
jgi:YD repeat-containing protein